MAILKDKKSQVIIFIGSDEGAKALRQYVKAIGIRWPFAGEYKFKTGKEDPERMGGVRFNQRITSTGNINSGYKPSNYTHYKRFTTN